MHGQPNIKKGQEMCCVTSYVDSTTFEVLSVVGWSDLTLRRLMSYIYGAPILDVSRSHTTTQHSR